MPEHGRLGRGATHRGSGRVNGPTGDGKAEGCPWIPTQKQ